jgi:DNA-binding transcriptional ArsR family regulator
MGKVKLMQASEQAEILDNNSRPESVMFIHQFIDEYDLDPFEFRIYAHVVRRTGGKTDKQFFASLSKTADICQISVRKIQQTLKFLYEAGFLDKDKREGRTDIYKLTPTSKWVNKDDLIEIRQRVTGNAKAKTKKISKTESQSDKLLHLQNQIINAGRVEILEKVESAILPQKLHPNLLTLIADTPNINIEEALLVLSNQKGRVTNPSGLLTKAIKSSWSSTKNNITESSSNL